jgi:hypothetical protein
MEYLWDYLGQGWWTYDMCAQSGIQKYFLSTQHSLLSQFFLQPILLIMKSLSLNIYK